jgi:pyruvate/2-oxoglutarate dehydrogenase complex dihydrolipoamide dehydrogenase (E3) component
VSISTDLAVIGGGAAGLGAAYAARRKGASVTLVERAELGGDCTWRGCVPSKTLLEQAHRVHGAREMGLDGEIDFGAVMRRVHDAVAETAEDESRAALESQGIQVLTGQASFTGARQLSVDGTALTAKAVVVATGSTALVPPIPGLRERGPLTNDTVFDLTTLPQRLAVLGGGPIGVELAQAFARLGGEVTILEMADRLLAAEEPEASETLRQVLADDGVGVALGSAVERVDGPEAGAATVTTGDGSVEAEAVLCALGRQPVTDGLELDAAGIERTESGHVATDDKLATSAKGVYAVGDVVGGLAFTHVGYDMGVLAAGNALGRFTQSWSNDAVPWATFTDPEVGRVGLTEADAHREHGSAAQVASMPLAETDRAKTAGRTAGLVKLVAGPHPVTRGLAGGRLLGATVVAPGGGDTIHEAALAMRSGLYTGRLAQTVHAYPAWAMALRETAAQFFFTHNNRRARPARP